MSLKPDRNMGNFQPAPEGTHIALCIHVIDLGKQPTQWGTKRQVYLAFELSEQLMADGRPFIVSRLFTNSLHEKSGLRQIIEPWIGRKEIDREDFDLSELAGKPALIVVSHREGTKGTFAEILAVSALPKSVSVPVSHNSHIVFDIDSSESRVLAGLPQWLQNKVLGVDKIQSDKFPFDDKLPF